MARNARGRARPRRARGGFTFDLTQTASLSAGFVQPTGLATGSTQGSLLLGQGDLRPQITNPPKGHKAFIRRLNFVADFIQTAAPGAQGPIDVSCWLCKATSDEIGYAVLNDVSPYSAGWVTTDQVTGVSVIHQWRFSWFLATGVTDTNLQDRPPRVSFNKRIRVPFRGGEQLYFLFRAFNLGAANGPSNQVVRYSLRAKCWNP